LNAVVSWLASTDEDRIYMSVVTLAELRHGVERVAAGHRRKRLNEWLEAELPQRFGKRILPIDAAVADSWGRIVARCETLGRPIGAMDALIAATAFPFAIVLRLAYAQAYAGTTRQVV
jgi:toxin FitB